MARASVRLDHTSEFAATRASASTRPRSLALRFEPAPIQRAADRLDVTAAYSIGALAAYWLIERTSAFFA
jgi:hypothetical protein